METMQESANRVRTPVMMWTGSRQLSVEHELPVEEPLEIFVDSQPFYLTMRTPGDELSLALGLCFSEGVIDSLADTDAVSYCADISTNRVNVYLSARRKERKGVKVKEKRSATYSSCGICGKELVDDICVATKPVGTSVEVPVSRLSEMQKILEARQELFRLTGATHVGGIFSASGDLLAFGEDVGRHNALDKAIGKVISSGRMGEAAVILLSSRLSYEMVQKAARLRVEILAGVSAPTALGVQLAQATNVTLIGFLRGDTGNVYTCRERIIFD